jgi:diguanylate cyclase (GGDEF)-like protein
MIFKALQSLLVERFPVHKDNPAQVVDMLFSRTLQKVPAVRNSSRLYLFRMGNTLLSVDFTQPPSPELLELVRLRLELVFEENMENFFQIVSSYSSDETMWRQRKDKGEIFFETLATFLGNAWKFFDLQECRVQINGGTDLYKFCNGSMVYELDKQGEGHMRRSGDTSFPDKVEDVHKEYMIRSMQLGINRDNYEPVIMDLYMKSRSLHNVNPRYNHLHHKFILLLIENLGKTIDKAIPALKAEEMKKHLKWKTFLDRSRLRSTSWGEDLYRILVDSVGILRIFMGLNEVSFFTPDEEFRKMLQIYRDNQPSVKMNFSLLNSMPTQKDMMLKNQICIRLLEVIGEQLTLIIALPVINQEEEGYLQGTFLMKQITKIARGLVMDYPKDFSYELVSRCLNGNPMVTMTNIVANWPLGDSDSLQVAKDNRITQFASRLVDSSSQFFDMIQFMDSNVEAGITNMRGSRDRLTGLYNRQKFNQILDGRYNDKNPFGLIFIDMDIFKIYNDAISHSFGDRLLIGIAERILSFSRLYSQKAIPGRFGGDEFCFALSDIHQDRFEEAASNLFRYITNEPQPVKFYYHEKKSNSPWEVNAISFLHRLLRPDVGGARGAASEFVEPRDAGPRMRLLEIYSYYQKEKGNVDNSWLESIMSMESLDEESISDITDFLCKVVLAKIQRNKMFEGVEGLFSETLDLFIRLQLMNKNTKQLRVEIAEFLKGTPVILSMHFKISAGLAHTDEDRLRSVSALFKAADSRAYIAKHNGRNGLFGLNNQRLL